MSTRKQKPKARTDAPAAKAAVRFDLLAVNVMLAALGVALFVGYLVMNSRTSTTGFAIRTAERAVSELEDERKRLDLQVVTAQSSRRVEEGVSGLGMVEVEVVEYLTLAPPSVAVK